MQNTLKSTTPLALALGASLLLAACGGGGGGGGNESTTPATSGWAINSANAQDVGARTYNLSAGLSSQVGNSSNLVGGVAVSAPASGLIDLSLQQLYLALHAVPAAPGLVAGVTVNETVACTHGGSAVVTINVANTAQLSPGDSLAISANNCQMDTAKLNGGFTVTFNSISGTPSPAGAWNASLTVNYTGFTSISGADTVSASGDMSMQITQISAQDMSISASGNTLAIGVNSNGSSAEATLSNYSYTGAFKSGVTSFSANYALSGNLPKLGNVAYTVKTSTEFKKQAGLAFPSQGVMTVTAADHSTVTLTVIDGNNVSVGLDKNGDGVTDETVATTWTALIAHL